MSVKIQFVLTDEAMRIIDSSASERKRGEFVSKIITEYASLVSGESPNSDGCGLLEQINNKLTRLDRQMALLVSSLQEK